LALATLLQAYCHVGDRDAVELTVMDKRWQLVLDCLGAELPPCSQGTLYSFRMRLMVHKGWRQNNLPTYIHCGTAQ
jgi:transposase